MPDGPDPDTQPLQAAGGPATGWVLGGRYRVLHRIGSGGMAEVFRAHDELLDRDVAVKVFRTLLDDPDSTRNGAARRELELQTLARLNHPHLITLYDGSVAGDGPAYLVLELVAGPDLASRLADGPLPEPEARIVGAQIADALAYVHAHGLVHRDVKPANILLGEPDPTTRLRARLSDFGIARMVGAPQVTSADLTVGTAYYLAPEQARGSAVGPEADVYALGLVLLEALTGQRAFDGPMHEALAARLAAGPAIPAALPAPWPELVAAMTAQDPAARPEAGEVARALSADATAATTPLAALAPVAPAAAAAVPSVAAAAPGPAAPPAAAATGPAPGRRRRRLVPGLLLAGALVAAVLVLGAFLLRPNPASSPGGTDPTTTPTTPRNSTVQHRNTAPAADPAVRPAKQKKTHKPTPTRSRRAPASSSSPATPAPRQSSSASATPTSSPASTTSSAPPSSSSPAPSSSTAQAAGGSAGAAGG